MIQLMLLKRPNETLGEVSMAAKMLAAKCPDGQPTNSWVSSVHDSVCVSVSLCLSACPGFSLAVYYIYLFLCLSLPVLASLCLIVSVSLLFL